jgi:hypothetical protein
MIQENHLPGRSVGVCGTIPRINLLFFSNQGTLLSNCTSGWKRNFWLAPWIISHVNCFEQFAFLIISFGQFLRWLSFVTWYILFGSFNFLIQYRECYAGFSDSFPLRTLELFSDLQPHWINCKQSFRYGLRLMSSQIFQFVWSVGRSTKINFLLPTFRATFYRSLSAEPRASTNHILEFNSTNGTRISSKLPL